MTPRQQDVVDELCKGKSNKEIARALGIAEATVKLHMTEIFKEFGVRNRAQALAKINPQLTATNSPETPTDQEILEEFTNTAFTTLNEKWSDRVLRFGRALLRHNVDREPKQKGQ